jgi:hypothetical protein
VLDRRPLEELQTRRLAMNAVALLLADSRFPAGGYAHSLGLEQAVAEGLSPTASRRSSPPGCGSSPVPTRH